MTSAAQLLRHRRRQQARPFPTPIPKSQHAEAFRDSAMSLLAYADQSPDARASALRALDLADQLERSPRCGWYPRRPKAWRP